MRLDRGIVCHVGDAGAMKAGVIALLYALLVASLVVARVRAQSVCQGAKDEAGLQSQLANAAPNSVVNICSNINLTATIILAGPVTLQGNCSSPGCKISAALPRTVNQLFSVAPGVGPVFFKNLQLDSGVAESSSGSTLLKGGAVLLSSASTTTFTSVLFTNNAADEGGAVYSDGANATFAGCTFSGNTATASGGAFQAGGGSVTILSSNFQQNKAPLGGGLYLQQTGVPAVVRGSLFVGNQATQQQGGAIFVGVRAVNVSIGGNTFAGNSAAVSGGAVHDDGASTNGAVVSSAFTVLSGNAFSQNSAPQGGAVSNNVAQTSFCSPQTFSNNAAPTGSILFASGDADSGQTTFCPAAPTASASGLYASDVNGVFATDCSACNCGANNPCDRNAVCTPGSRTANLTCACRTGFSGNGYVCFTATNSSLLVGNTGASTSLAALASLTNTTNSTGGLSPANAPFKAPAPAPVASNSSQNASVFASAPSPLNSTLTNSTLRNTTAPLVNATTISNGSNATIAQNSTAVNASLVNTTALAPAPAPVEALVPSAAPAAGPSGNGSAIVIPLPLTNATSPTPAPGNSTGNVTTPALAPLGPPPHRGTNASFPPPHASNASLPPPASFPPPLVTNASFPPPLVTNASFPPPLVTNASFPPPLVTNASFPPPLITNASSPPPLPFPPPLVTFSPPPPAPPPIVPPLVNATAPAPLELPPPPPVATNASAPPPLVPPPPSFPPPGAAPPPPLVVPPPPAGTGGLLGVPVAPAPVAASPPPPVCTCPTGQAPGIGASAANCNCTYPLTASYRLSGKNLADWTPLFASSFTSDLANLLGVSPSQVLYTDVAQGSILLDSNVVPLSGPTLDNATVSKISGVLQQGQSLPLNDALYGPVLVTSVGLPAQLTSDSPPSSSGATTPGNPTPSSSPTTSSSSSGGGGTSIGIIIGAVVGGVVVLAIIAAIIAALVTRKKRKNRKLAEQPSSYYESSDRPSKSLERPLSARQRTPSLRNSSPLPTPGREDIADKALFGTFRRFGFPELQEATDDFAPQNLLGEGGFGLVYKGLFGDGTMLAVKLLKSTQQGQAESEFLSELGTLGRVRHRNLVALKGFCVSDQDRFLILDYAAGGNLDQALRNVGRPLLTWPQRMNIAVGAARGLSYLHNDCRPTIIHRDIKSANILLDANGEAEVADFGLSKLLDSNQTHQSTRVRGTYGYVAPEYAMYGQVTKKTDVYSFGVVLLELITGLKALDVSQSGERRTLAEWVLKRHQQPLSIVDPRLEGEFFREQAEKFISLALACINPSPERRPSMLDILRTLETLNPSGSVPNSPLGSPERSGDVMHADAYPTTSSDWSTGTGSGTRRTPVRPTSGGSGSSHSWSQANSSTVLQNTMQYNMTGINEGR